MVTGTRRRRGDGVASPAPSHPPTWSAGEGKEDPPLMRLHGAAQRLTILVDTADQWHHHPVYVEVVRRAHRAGLAGATVFHGEQGFAAGSPIHTTHPFWPGGHLPAMIVIVD